MEQNSSSNLLVMLVVGVIILLAFSLVTILSGTARDIEEAPDTSLGGYTIDIDAAEPPVLKLYCDPEDVDGGE